MSFTEQEVEYLRSQPLARLATVNSDGGPDVVPVAFEFDGTFFWVGGVGEDVSGTLRPHHTDGVVELESGRRACGGALV